MFPKILPFHARHDRDAFTVATLDELSRFPVVILDWNDEARAGWAPDNLTPGQYLRQANPGQTQLAYIPAAYWWTDRTMSPAVAPHRCAVQEHIIAGQHWLTRPDGSVLCPWPNQPLLSPDGIAILASYIKHNFNPVGWDGIHFDVLTPEIMHLGASPDQSHAVWQAMLRMVDSLPTDIIQGNGSWAPLPEDISEEPPWRSYLEGAMVERFPTYPWYGYESKMQPDYPSRWFWHMSLAYQWESYHSQSLYAFHDDGLDEHAYYGQFVKTYAQGRRFVLASACLAGVWYTPPMRQSIPWCDEMAVLYGATTKDELGIGWLGEPAQSPPTIMGAMRREFEHGQVLLNATTQNITFDIGPGYRRIAGWYDKHTNDGQRVDGSITLAPYDAIFLLRDGASKPDTRRQQLELLHAASLKLETALQNNARCIAEYESARRAWQAALDALKD